MKKTFSIIGIVVGAIVIVFGFIVMGLDTGSSYLYSTEFGGDFYTYSYKATRIAAENVNALAEIVNKGIAFILIAIGATDICVFGCKLADAKNPQITSAPITVKQETQAEVSEELPEI